MNTYLLPCLQELAVPERDVPQISCRLRSAGYHAMLAIDHEYHDGTVILRGRVSTYYMKQVAQAVLMADPMIKVVVNLIEVCSDNRGP